jgi:hypothetical protein
MGDEAREDGQADRPSDAAADVTEPAHDPAGPDPVIGAGIALLGIFLMGTGGSADAHYVFDVGVLTATVGAVVFVLFVALSALKQRRAEQVQKDGEPPPEQIEPV